MTIGHANGIVTIDLAESLDAHREALRISLGEPYRTMLGHFRHEVGHYYEWILVEQTGWIDECRTLFGDERASYRDAIARHYRTGAPRDWAESFISEYATMHPWEDFAECFAHYLHLTGTLQTAAGGRLTVQVEGVPQIPDGEVRPRTRYSDATMDEVLADWLPLSTFLNRVNRAMGKHDLYPFTISAPVARKLDFVHRVVTASRVRAPAGVLDQGERVRGDAGGRRHVDHEGVDRAGGPARGAQRRDGVGVGASSTSQASRIAVRPPAVVLGHGERGRLDADRRQAGVGHAAHGGAADDRADADDGRGRGAQRVADAGDREDRADRDHGVRRRDHHDVGVGDRVEHAGRRSGGRDVGLHEPDARAARPGAGPTTPRSGSCGRPRRPRASRPRRRSSAAA